MTSNIKDVARRAGVSIATVSYVINGTRQVKADTRQRVLKAIEGLNYKPNMSARNLRTQKTATILVVVPEKKFNEMGADIILLLNYSEKLLAERGYRMVLQYADDMDGRVLEVIHANDVNYAGLVVFRMKHQAKIAQASLDLGIPCTIVNYDLAQYEVSREDTVNIALYYYDQILKQVDDLDSTYIVANDEQGEHIKRLFAGHIKAKNLWLGRSDINYGYAVIENLFASDMKAIKTIVLADYKMILGMIKYLLIHHTFVLQGCTIQALTCGTNVECFGLPINVVSISHKKIASDIIDKIIQ